MSDAEGTSSAVDAAPDRGHRITPAVGADLPGVLALLAAVDLPGDGVAALFDGFLVARDARGALVGCAGVERHGSLGLLRSVAVAPGRQRSGLGSRLVEAALERAARAGATEIVLLTTTAREFFVRRFGFAEAGRGDYDERLAASPEWRLPRCSSAVVLRRELGADAGARGARHLR